MIDPVRELKIRAELLHHGVQAGEPTDLERLRRLPELRSQAAGTLSEAAAEVQRKHCLAAVAREVGFQGWAHALRVLEGDAAELDFGRLLHQRGCAAYVNPWFSSYPEAREHLAARGTYLLAYKTHFVVTERGYVETLGLDPDDADWAALGWDWARPREPAARRRLYGKLLARRTIEVL